MRKISLLIILLIQANLLFSQIEILDEKNGFKSLQLGTTIEEFNFPNSQMISDNELILYNTSDSELKQVFNTKMDSLFIYFNENELAGIILQKNFKSNYDFEAGMREVENLRKKFTEVLGKHNTAANDEFGFGPVWAAEKVTLYVLYQLEEMKIDDSGNPMAISNVKVMFLKKTKKSGSHRDGF